MQLPVTSVLTSLKAKKGNKLLILKDSQWALAESLVEVLAPAEAAPCLFSAQDYVTSSVVLPLVIRMVAELRKEKVPHMARFQATLADELEKKFQLQSLTASSSLVLSAAIDPRFQVVKFCVWHSKHAC